ncbi:small cell adhesion glycoprotein [Eulemur rufifrons]|uniref:small cell adhesion glycoprotein n=1 Tax=Eulemur rufifrons TaxID=859984 RepID=UPI0037449C64
MRRRGPGEGGSARRAQSPTHAAATPATAGTETESGRSSAFRWSCGLQLLRTRRPGTRRLQTARGVARADLPLPRGLQPLAAMTSLLATPPPEELMTTPILQATEPLSPEAGASTALIAVVITVVFLTLLSVVILIFFYLYKNKGSYVTYESAEGEPSAILQMENDSAKGREKEEYFI